MFCVGEDFTIWKQHRQVETLLNIQTFNRKHKIHLDIEGAKKLKKTCNIAFLVEILATQQN